MGVSTPILSGAANPHATTPRQIYAILDLWDYLTAPQKLQLARHLQKLPQLAHTVAAIRQTAAG
jgi:hypothetical protein